MRRSRSCSNVRFIGLDVHAETIAVAVAEPTGEVRSLGIIPNRPEPVRRLMRRLEATGPVTRVLRSRAHGVCAVLAIGGDRGQVRGGGADAGARQAGDRVKTDRRDALKLARSYRAGDLTAVWVPDAAHEALRDLVRAREAAKKDQLRARHRLSKFLLRQGRRPPASRQGMDAGLSRVGEERRAFCARRPGGDAAGLRPRSRSRDGAARAARAGPHRRDPHRAGADAGGHRGAPSAARRRAGLGGHDRQRGWRLHAICPTAAS